MGTLMHGLLNARRIAVVGVAKNCGKTTTLNYLVKLAQVHDRVVGVMSIGLDGESEDVLLGTPKPPVSVEPGQWIVTADKAAHAGTAALEFVTSLDIETPLGNVAVCRVVDAGEVVLAGLRHRADVRLAIASLESSGVDLIIVDGAYGRIAAAHATLTDGVVVSTGAVVGADVDTITARTGLMVDRLQLDEIDSEWQSKLLRRAMAEDQTLLGGSTIEPIALHARSALIGLSKSRELWTDQVEAIAIPGLVSDRVVDELLRAPGPRRTLLIADGTAFQSDSLHLSRLQRSWQIKVESRANVLGISINPTSVQGWAVDDAALRDGLRSRWPEITIFNPVHALESL